MPNVLKKVPSSVPKNQKSITHFFKNTTGFENNKSESLGKSQEGQIKSAKRKTSCQTNSEAGLVGNHATNIQNDCITGAASKKSKTDTVQAQLSKTIIEKEFQLSTTKENVVRKSPRKTNQSMKLCIEAFAKDNEEIVVLNRPPLSPIKNIEAVELNNKNNVLEEPLLKSNDGLMKTPEKSRSSMKKTTKSSQVSELRCSPRIAKFNGPETVPSMSPCKLGSSVKPVDCLDFNDVGFDVAWENLHFEDVCKEDLDLSVMQRCELMNVEHHPQYIKVRLKSSDKEATCLIEGIWRTIHLTPGEIVSVIASRVNNGSFSINTTHGLLVLRPDHLMSTTSVVAGVFCRRKAVLQERFKGIDGGNVAMTVGILIHELVQKALTQRIDDVTQLRRMVESILAASAPMLYESKISTEEMIEKMNIYIEPLANFVRTYVLDKPSGMKNVKKQWNVHIDDVLDIEENICCPQLGLKGKIDATLQVTIHDRKGRKTAIVPLELKSGRASGSAEHRGQIAMYNMMMSVQRASHPTDDEQIGALLYLKDKVDFREVSCGYPEKRDLIMLRNELVQYLTSGPDSIDTEKLADIEEASQTVYQNLPEPVHHTACGTCPYLNLCSLHLWHTKGPKVSESHPLSSLRESALGHLTEKHIKYFLRQVSLLMMEERAQMKTSPLHALWTEEVDKRSKRGTCAADLTLKSVKASDSRFLHIFERKADQQSDTDNKDNRLAQGPQEGEFSIVSIKDRPWIAAGVILVNKGREIQVLLERDLSRRQSKEVLYHIDTYESYNTTVQNLTNLGALLDNNDNASRIRRYVIDRQKSHFLSKLPRTVADLGEKLLVSLNLEQQRAVLRAMAAGRYYLLEGLPGTGKTQTVSLLIQMLVGVGKRVLVTAHTHSAVDTVLSRLPSTVRIMRIGSTARVAPNLLPRCETNLIQHCDTPKQLSDLYNFMQVVGVTCLGAAHPMLAQTTFDLCIVDEATQVTQCELLRPLLQARRFVLVGDPEQLPPVVRSRAARRLGLEDSLFHRLKDLNATSTLQLQYRMNETLTKLANEVAYGGRLKCADDSVRLATVKVDYEVITKIFGTKSPWILTACCPDLNASALFIDMGVKGTNANRHCANADEACVVLQLLEAFREGGVNPTDVGIIAPYREQVSLLRRATAFLNCPLEVSTVDQFQGKDKSVILYSCARSDDGSDEVKEGEVLNDQRRLAVSVTRSKHKLIIIGHARALRKYTPLQKVIEACVKLYLPTDERDRLVNKYGPFVS